MTPITLTIRVNGTPGAQGSKRFVGRHGGRGVMVESSKKVTPWRQDVKAAAETAIDWIMRGEAWTPYTGPVHVHVDFRFARPKSHYRTGRHAATRRPDAPTYSTSRANGDLDKLERSSYDALVAAGVLEDDSLIAASVATKRYCMDYETPGATFTIRELL